MTGLTFADGRPAAPAGLMLLPADGSPAMTPEFIGWDVAGLAVWNITRDDGEPLLIDDGDCIEASILPGLSRLLMDCYRQAAGPDPAP